MESLPSDPQGKLMRALRFTEADLDANAHGRLSFGQRVEHRDEEVPSTLYVTNGAKAALALIALAVVGAVWLCGQLRVGLRSSALEQCAHYQTVAPDADPVEYDAYGSCLDREGYNEAISPDTFASYVVLGVVIAGSLMFFASKLPPRPSPSLIPPIESADGIVKLHIESDGSAIIGYYIDVAETRFQVQPEVYHAFEHGLPYRVYYQPAHIEGQPTTGTILSAECLRGKN